MTDESLIDDFDRLRRWYLILRLVMLAFTATWTVWAAVDDVPGVDVTLAIAATAVYLVTTLGAFIVMGIPAYKSGRTFLWFVVPDLAYAGLLGLAFVAFDDPSYPMLLSLATLYALYIRYRGTWVVGLAAAFVYLAIQATVPVDSAMAYSMVLLKATQLVVIPLICHVTSMRLARREQEARERRQHEDELKEQLQRRISELKAVSQIGDIIHSQLSFDRTGPLIVEILSKILGVQGCSLFVIDKVGSETVFSASSGMIGTPAAFRGPEDLALSQAAHPEDHYSCTPVIEHANMIVVFCADAKFVEEISEDDRIVLEAVSHELVVAVENAQLYKLTRQQAITDELTGLHNYRYLQQRLDEEIERARRYEKEFSLLMIDVDDFKGFNDRNGHMAGDRALRELGKVMSSVVREVDVVCRYGGEEFSVVLPETDAAGAFVTAAKVLEAIENHDFAEPGSEAKQHITVSIGLATYPTHASDKEMLLKTSDDALYRAKNTGKNRVRSARKEPLDEAETEAVKPELEERETEL